MSKPKIGDKVMFVHGYGTVVDKRRSECGYHIEYDVQLDLGYAVETDTGYVECEQNRGRVYTVRNVEIN